jgi:uncharacterized membrane protein YdbT with pleckstrin-like domain
VTSDAESVLQPDEKVVITRGLHWIVYARGIFLLVLGSGFLLLTGSPERGAGWAIIGGFVLVYGFLVLIHTWFDRWITEFTVTTHRVICKRGFIYRQTAEMNMDKVKSVTVSQSLLGRILDYGSIHVLGTGQGIEHLHRIASPLTLRNAIAILAR